MPHQEMSYQEHVILPQLPMAIYQELAVHLRQLPGVETKLVPQDSRQFDYQASQVGSLVITCNNSLDPLHQQQVTEILDYYSDRYCGGQIEKFRL